METPTGLSPTERGQSLPGFPQSNQPDQNCPRRLLVPSRAGCQDAEGMCQAAAGTGGDPNETDGQDPWFWAHTYAVVSHSPSEDSAMGLQPPLVFGIGFKGLERHQVRLPGVGIGSTRLCVTLQASNATGRRS